MSGEGPKIPLIAAVGAAVGGAVVVMAAVTVSAVFVIFLCMRKR